MKACQQSKSWNPTDSRKWFLYALHRAFSIGHHHRYAPLFHSYTKKPAIRRNTVSSSLHVFTDFPVYMLLPITFPAWSGWSSVVLMDLMVFYISEWSTYMTKHQISPLLSHEQLQYYYSEAQNTSIHLHTNYITQTYFCTQTTLTILIEPWLEIAGARERRNCIQIPCNEDCHPINEVDKTTAATKKFWLKNSNT